MLEYCPDITLVQFVDGDCELEPHWPDRAMNFFETQPQIAAVCGRRRERYPNASLYNRMYDEEWNTPTGQAETCGRDALIRVRAFVDIGGYDAMMIAGEEPELCSRLRTAGWQIWRLDLPMTVHDADMHRFDQYWKRAIRSGFGYAQILCKTASAGGDRLYKREVGRALFWTLGVPLAALLCAVIFGVAGLILAPVIWVTQWVRLGLRHGFAKGGHKLISKIAETIGILRFLSAQMQGRNQGAIFYK